MLINVVSIVCKQWRKYALNAVTSLQLGSPLRAKAVEVLPSLTDLRVCTKSEAVPTSLRRLEVVGINSIDFPANCKPFADATSLRLIALSLRSKECSRTAWTIVRNNRTSLTSLRCDHLPPDDAVCALPQLVSLRLELLRSSNADASPKLILDHASLLTSLRVSGRFSRCVLEGPSFPRLRSLHICVAQSELVPALKSFVLRTPSLTSLNVAVSIEQADELERLATLLTGLYVFASNSLRKHFCALAALPLTRLRSLCISGDVITGAERLIGAKQYARGRGDQAARGGARSELAEGARIVQ